MARPKARTLIHVNQHIIKSNKKNGADEPVLTVKRAGTNTYAHQAVIYDDAGNEVARVVYSPHKPLDCGARVWIETRNEVKTFGLPDVEDDAA